MIILIPIILLILFAVVINYLGRYKFSTGSTWLVTAVSVFIIWILLIIFRVALPDGLSITNWSPLGISSDALVFRLSEHSWFFAFLLSSLLIGIILTDTVRLDQGDNMVTWTGSMVLAGVGFLSIFSQTFLAAIITWTIIDMVEIGILIKVTVHERVHHAAILEFTVRTIGSLMVVGALVLSGQHGTVIETSSLSQGVYLLILLGTTLRLGILPLHIPLTANLPIRRSLGTMLRFVAPISVLSFLSQIQPQVQYSELSAIFLPILAVTALFGAIKWLNAKNELIGRSYWMLAFSGLALVAFISGDIGSVIALSLFMISAGGFIFLFSFSSLSTRIMSGILLVGMIGFPLTPTSPMWSFVINTNQILLRITIILTISLLNLGFARHILRPREQKSPIESWMKLFNLGGLLILVISPWITLFWGYQEDTRYKNFIIPAICLVLTLVFYAFSKSKIWTKFQKTTIIKTTRSIWGSINKLFSSIFQFDWFFSMLDIIYGLVARPLGFFVKLLEGDGGLFWAFLFLALISSILMGQLIPNG